MSGPTLDVSTDYLVFDGVESVRFHQVGADAVVGSSGVVRKSSSAVTAAHALRRQLSTKEIARSGGAFKAGDVVFSIAVAELATEPKLVGDWIEDAAGLRWNVIAFDKAALGSRWRVYARR